MAGQYSDTPEFKFPPPQLTAQEILIIRLLAAGLSNKQIARAMALSPLTIKNHISRIGRKLRDGSREGIVKICVESGWVATVPRAPGVVVSDRELEVIHLAARGYTNKQIGVSLTLSAYTVKSHLQRIFYKLHIHTRIELIPLFVSPAEVAADASCKTPA